MSHILRPTGQKSGMAHILLPLGYHSVQSNIMYRSMNSIAHTYTRLSHGQAPRASKLEYSVREKTTDLFCDEAESFGTEARCWN